MCSNVKQVQGSVAGIAHFITGQENDLPIPTLLFEFLWCLELILPSLFRTYIQ